MPGPRSSCFDLVKSTPQLTEEELAKQAKEQAKQRIKKINTIAFKRR